MTTTDENASRRDGGSSHGGRTEDERRGGVERDADGGAADEVDVENDDKGGEIRCSEF